MNDTPSEALVGYMLSMHLFALLEKKGVMTHAEALQAIDDIQLNLETHQHRAGSHRKAAFEGARGILESLRGVISDES